MPHFCADELNAILSLAPFLGSYVTGARMIICEVFEYLSQGKRHQHK